MLSKNKFCKQSYSDADDVRIEQLIAKYADKHEDPWKSDSDDIKADANYFKYRFGQNMTCNSTSTPSAHSVGQVQANPMQHDNYYMYKIGNSDSDSGDDDNIKLLCDPRNDGWNCQSCETDPNTYKADVDYYRPPNRVTFGDVKKNVDQQTSLTFKDITIACTKPCADKTTFCRPIQRAIDKHLVHKVNERNAKLQMLLSKFVIARQKEKEQEQWNNYVNALKMKHHSYRDYSKQFSMSSRQRESPHTLLINDCYNTKDKLDQSDSCREILHDFYSTRNELLLDEENICFDSSMLKGIYGNQLHCFPSVSGIRKTSKEDNHKLYRRSPHSRTLYGSKGILKDKHGLVNTALNTDSILNISQEEATCCAKTDAHNAVRIIDLKQSKDVQTNISFGSYNYIDTFVEDEIERELQATFSKQACMRSNREVHNESGSKDTTKGRQDLEGKLDTLIDLFHSFISELKTNIIQYKSNDGVVEISDSDEKQITANTKTSETVRKKKKVTIVGNVMTNTSFSSLEPRHITSHHLLDSKLNKILYEELNKSNKLRTDIEAMLNLTTSRPCAVQISADIPTRERSTEVSASLSKTKLSESRSNELTVQDLSSPSNRQMPQENHRVCVNERMQLDYGESSDHQIAVSAGTLGLLALLKLSTRAVKQILSLVPTVTSWYPSGSPPARGATDYVCNVCGAAFARPSELTTHILGHNLGHAKDCRVCQLAIDARRPSQLFRCRYCGQRFARAYCCELHQQGCARRLGRAHDVSSSLAMLR